jgi:hypothetical protein
MLGELINLTVKQSSSKQFDSDRASGKECMIFRQL